MNVIDGRGRAIAAVVACASFVAAGNVRAQSEGAESGPGLQGLASQYSNGVERAAAVANMLVFDALEPDCNPGGVFDFEPSPEYDDLFGRQATPGPLCTADTFHVYLNARELVHTANELQGSGPTVASLGLDLEGLGLALRWTAAEELSAQGSMATEFANGQLSSLAGRLSALRFGSTGFGTAAAFELMRRDAPLLAQAGGAAAPESSETYSPWGGFVNYGFGYGSRAPTLLEDAFDFDGSEVTIGVDYRLGTKLVLGGIVGSTRQAIDFDEAASAISVVDGDIDADGTSFMVFALMQGERLTLSGSLGTQSLDYVVTRNIQYPSFNPNTDSVYSTARSEPDSDVFTTTFNVGYGFGKTKFTLEPYFNLERLDVTIGAFAENRSIDRLSTSGESRRFDLAVSRQDFESLETSLGVRFQYIVTPRFGVIVPYWTVATHWEHEDGSRTITTGYAALADVLGSTTFALPTDERDARYHTIAVGASAVLRGGRQREAGGPIMGGLSAFLQLVTVEQRRHFDDQAFTIGFRYEF
jgi:hypothetical protein